MLRRSVGRPPPEPVLKAVAPEKSPVRGVVELLGICRTHLNPGARGAAEFAAPKPAGGAAKSAEAASWSWEELGGPTWGAAAGPARRRPQEAERPSPEARQQPQPTEASGPR